MGIPVVTTEKVPGHENEKTQFIGIVAASSLPWKGDSYAKLVAQTTKRLAKAAEKLGATAVVGAKFDYDMTATPRVLGTGTAIVFLSPMSDSLDH
jgi:hypothetical protein